MIYSSEFIYLLKALLFSVEETCSLLKSAAKTHGDKIYTSSNNTETRMQRLCKKSNHLIYYDDLLCTEHQLNASDNRETFFHFRYFKIQKK